jgi:hypothetical protein
MVGVVMKIPPFDPADLKPIRQLYKEGKFPSTMTLQGILRLCTKREFPCVNIGNEWNTTELAIRAWVWDRANSCFRKITS